MGQFHLLRTGDAPWYLGLELGHLSESMSNRSLNHFRMDFQFLSMASSSPPSQDAQLPPTFEAPSNAWRATPSWSPATTVGPPSSRATLPTWAATRWWPGATPTRRAATPGAPGSRWPTHRRLGWMAPMGSIRCWPPCRAVVRKGEKGVSEKGPFPRSYSKHPETKV